MREIALVLALMMLSSVVGCAAPNGATHLDIPAGSYDATFDAAREVLRETQFDLERVDAGAGVISTQPKHSAGFMTPWDPEQSTLGQEVEDAMQNQRRVVRVTFEPAGDAATGDTATGGSEPVVASEPVDLRSVDEGLRMNVRVTVLRSYKPGWQVQTGSVRLSTYSYDPALGRRGMFPDYETAVDEDRGLAAWLTKEIAGKLGIAVE